MTLRQTAVKTELSINVTFDGANKKHVVYYREVKLPTSLHDNLFSSRELPFDGGMDARCCDNTTCKVKSIW